MKKLLFFGAVLFCCCFLGKSVSAEETSKIIESPYYQDAYTQKIPAENTFIMRNGELTTFEKIAGNVQSDKMITGKSSTSLSAVLIRNVGVYQGKMVNVKVTLEMLKPLGTDLLLTKEEFLRLQVWSGGVAKVTYEFLNQDLQPFPLKTTFNFKGLNKWKNVTINNSDETIDHLYATPDSAIAYQQQNNEMTLTGTGDGSTFEYDSRKIAITTKAIDKFEFIIKNNDTRSGTAGISEVQYLSQFFPNVEYPYAQVQKTSDQKIINNEVVTNFQQIVPSTETNNKISTMTYLIKEPQQNQFCLKNVTIKDFYGVDRTGWFNQQVDQEGNLLVSIKSSTLTNEEFYDNTYQFTVHHTFIGGKNRVVAMEAIENNKFELQPTLVETIEQEQQLLGEMKTKIDYLSEIKIKYLDKDNKELLPEGSVTGLITTSTDLSNFYPVLAGYQPLRENKINDQAVFMPQIQTKIHHYRKEAPLMIHLKNVENPEIISRFSKEKEINYEFSHDEAVDVMFVAQCGEEQKIVKKYAGGNVKKEDTVLFKIPDDWAGKEIRFYLQSSLGERSNEEIRKFIFEDGVKLQLPEKLNFGIQEIPSKEILIAANNQEEIQINDSSHIDKSKWSVKVKLLHPMANSNNQILRGPFLFVKKDKKITINNEEQLIWAGSGTDKLDKHGQLKFMLTPSDVIGTYSGTLHWSLEEAPI